MKKRKSEYTNNGGKEKKIRKGNYRNVHNIDSK